jgi:hypothetical protein
LPTTISPTVRPTERTSVIPSPAMRFYRVAGKPGPEEWKVYRCWISDLRYADLSYTQLDGAVLTGADLREADFTGARFSDTDLSRANLTGAYGLTREALKHACAGIAPPNYVDKNAQPVGLPAWIGNARLRPCLVDEEKASKAAIDPLKEGVDLPKKEDVIAADDELTKKLAQRSWWRSLLGKYWSPFVAPVLAVLSAMLLFELVGKFAHSKLAIIGGILEALPVRFPEKSLTYSAKQLKLFKDQHPGLARQYRFPILVPLDLIAMGSIAAAAIYSWWTWLCLAQSNLSAHFVLTVCSILPLLYLQLTDFAENMVLCRYLGSGHFDEMSISHLKRLTFAKMITFGLSGVQVAASAVLALVTAALPWAVAWADSLGWL